ncbi:hypothetical protein NM688_g4955 [Phlebia brevispora]|uniref:Uncharacterized protein n=1 Tax=Phlebia brevispora TaxID=194682 RepID=A0ACC1T1N3_9APHY|nr:hypothetical protein NM688_g4955 [Phlebia brevispora]
MSKQRIRIYTEQDVAEHCTYQSCWISFNGKVYDVTKFLADHPGGDDLILGYAGKDIGKIMKDSASHDHSESAFDMLEEFAIGRVGVGEISVSDDWVAEDDFEPEETDTAKDFEKNEFLDLRRPMLPQVWFANFSKSYYLQQVHQPRHLTESALLFGPAYLEVFSKTAWYVIPTIWLPIAAYLYIRSTLQFTLDLSSVTPIPASTIVKTTICFLFGNLVWTFLEYMLHRFLFHLDYYLPDHPAALTLHFVLHGIHHYLPMDRLRLVMPPALFAILSFPFTQLAHLIFPGAIGNGIIAGAYVFYVLYDCMHYALHHTRLPLYMKEMKKYHLAHHYKNFDLGFGVTSKMWDYVFNTVVPRARNPSPSLPPYLPNPGFTSFIRVGAWMLQRSFSLFLFLLLFDLALGHTVVGMDPTPNVPPDDTYTKHSHPGAKRLDVEGYPVAPSELELEQVHVYVRHGERTPVRIRMSEPPASIPQSWMLCHTARRFSAAVASNATYGSNEELPLRRVVEREDGSLSPGECMLGELTDVGRQTTYDFGLGLRRLQLTEYVRLGFLPDTIHSDNDVYFRSTNVPRTVESLHQIIHGLYPAVKCHDSFAPQIRIRNAIHENLFGNTGACKRLEILELGFARAAAASWNRVLEPLDDKVSKYIGGNPIRLDGKPRASGVLDTVRAAVANNVSVPRELTDRNVIDVIEKAVVHEWFGGYSTDEVRRLGMGRLLSDISVKMQKKATQDEAPRILVHSTHDTTLAAICATFDVFDEKWPAFTSYISFELFRKYDNESSAPSPWQTILSPFRRPDISNHYVRMRYQNRNMILPMCQAEGKHLPGHPEFCTLAAFRDRVKELTPVDWTAECSPGAVARP